MQPKKKTRPLPETKSFVASPSYRRSSGPFPALLLLRLHRRPWSSPLSRFMALNEPMNLAAVSANEAPQLQLHRRLSLMVFITVACNLHHKIICLDARIVDYSRSICFFDGESLWLPAFH
ncbi:hypothetical protein EUTSA_v10012387mg [Eutrema salsugineum]|uniref:Uncharacterized protein n=1 Tax=Eutrema salsugineum TaxID=72664 RepID=V4MF72_EUTSA|nr:hypothetical protein EUTSA_v10012387mg [Eutrema salsugineum]